MRADRARPLKSGFGGISRPLAAWAGAAGRAAAAAYSRTSCLPPEPEPEAEPSGVQRFDEAELLDGGQRRAVGELDPGGAEPDALGGARDEGDEDRRGRAGDTRVEVVLGEPVAPVAEPFRLPGEVDGVAHGFGDGRAGADRDEVAGDDERRTHRRARL